MKSVQMYGARDTGVRMWGVAFFCASFLNVYNTLI